MAPAVEFCVKYFDVSGITVAEPINEFRNIPNNIFDIAAMGSLITHLSEEDTYSVLKNFLCKIKPEGIAVITTHGVRVHEMLLAGNKWFELASDDRNFLLSCYLENKFGYVHYAQGHFFERKTVDCLGTRYGISLIPHCWMIGVIKELGFSVLDYQKGGWDNHQDVFVIGK